MKSINRAIDRFCQKHRNFGIPRLMLFVVILTAVVFLIGGAGMIAFLAFSPAMILQGQVWRIITWIFIPVGGNFFFTLIALYVYYFIGSTLEREWGTAKFTIFYILGIILNVIYSTTVWLGLGIPAPLSPIFLNLSMFFSFATLFPDFTFRLFFIIPVKVKWLALVNAGFFLYQIISGIVTGNPLLALLPVIALFNYFIICGDDLLSLLRPLKARTSPQTINFKKAARQVKKDIADKPYRHKCAVCGKNDAENPELDFRYCSQCEGYHCFCLEHINNHIHFGE